MRRLTNAQPMTYGTVSGIVSALTSRYAFLGAAPIGCDTEGHTLWGMTLGGGRHRVLIAAGFCASEQLTSLLCLRLCEDLCDALDGYRMLNGWDVHRAMMGRTVVFVPYYCIADSAENQASPLKALCRRCDFRHVVSICGNDHTIHWRRDISTPTESELMARVLGAASDCVVSDASSHDEFKDWFMDTFHRPGFTLGLGDVSVEAFEKFYEKTQEMLLISALL